MRRSMSQGLLLLALGAASGSCTALLGLDDKPFTGGETTGTTTATTTGTGGAGGSPTTTTGTGGNGGTTTTTTGTGGNGGSTTGTGGAGGGSGGSGTVLWTVGSQGTGTQDLRGVAVAQGGQIWIVGSFQTSLILPGCNQISGTAASSVFWAKLDPEGKCEQLHWLGGGTSADVAMGLAIALDGGTSPAIAGSFKGALNDPQGMGSLVSTAGTQDVFIAYLDPSDGHVIHKVSWAGTGEDQVSSLVFDDGHDLYAGGSFKGQLTVPTLPVPTVLTSTAPAVLDGFLARLSASGTPTWGQRLGAPGHTTAIKAVTFVSSEQAIAFTGTSGGDVNGMCGWGPPGGAGVADVFHAAVDKNGVCKYGMPGGATGSASGLAIDSDSFGRLVSGGTFNGSVNLGPNPPISSTGADNDGFVARVDWNHGSPMPAVATFFNGGGAGQHDSVSSLFVDGSDGLSITGWAENFVDFSGPGFAGHGGYDAVVAHYDALTFQLLWAKTFGDDKLQQGRGVAADPNDKTVVAGGVFQGALNGAGNPPPMASPGFQSVYVMKLSP
ncbi:MAG: hypothetical protein U0359_31205 [Byssovorax sp.]